jgi:hypothetical protein
MKERYSSFHQFPTVQVSILLAAVLVFLDSINVATALASQQRHHVFAGTGGLEVQLIAAKLAIKSGDTCSIIGPSDDNYVKKCMALMYGQKVAADNNNDDSANGKGDNNINAVEMPEFVSDGDDIGESLAKADNVILVCEDKAFDDNFIDILLSNAPKARHLALLSRQGGKLKLMENSVRNKCKQLSTAPDAEAEARDVAFSVVRAGILVGGGPGGDVEGVQGGEEWGLSKHFYDTKFELSEAMNIMAMDKFTMGVKVTPGDPFKGPNFFSKVVSGNSFEARDGDTSRTAAAQALLAAARRRGDNAGVDVSISTEKGTVPPTAKEWDALLVTN